MRDWNKIEFTFEDMDREFEAFIETLPPYMNFKHRPYCVNGYLLALLGKKSGLPLNRTHTNMFGHLWDYVRKDVEVKVVMNSYGAHSIMWRKK